MKNMLPKLCVSLIVCVVLIGFQVFCIAQNQQPGDHSTMKTLSQWTAYTPMPSPKINHASVLYNGVVFVFGGSTTGGVASNDTYLYNIASDTWITGIAIPETRNFGTAEVVNGKIYLIGGYSQLAAPFILNTSVLELDPATSNISIKSNMPTAIAGCASFVLNNKIFILGGSGSGGWNIDYKDLVQIYDPATDLWSTGTQLPYAARNIAAAANGSTIIIAGGYGKTPTFKNSAYRGEVSGTTITWTKMPDYPEGGINRVSAGASGTKMFFTGGQTQTATSAKTFAFNLSTNTWEPQQDKPTPIHSSSKLIYDGSSTLYAFGGQASTTPTAVTEAILAITQPVIKVNTAGILSTLQINTSRKYSFMISNSGSANLIWNASIEPSSVKWATLNPLTGNVAPDNSQNAAVDISANGLSTGDYTASVKITSNDPDPNRSIISIPINLHVQTDPPDVGKKILLEEATGTWCGWCPYGVDSIHAILQRAPENVAVVSYHNGDAMSTPIETDMEKFLSITFFPGGNINRIKFAKESSIHIDRGVWGHYVDSLLAVDRSPVAITLSNKMYNPVTKQMSLRVNVRFIQTTPGPLRLNLIQTESGLNYEQDKYNWPIPKLYPYYHEHVVRLVLPNKTGDVITESTPIAAGTVFMKDYTFTSKDSLSEKCEFVVLVHKSNGIVAGEVLQAFNEEMMYQTAIATDVVDVKIPKDYLLEQNYPNPFNPSTTIQYSIPRNTFVRIKVFNVFGKKVATLISEVKDAGNYSVQWETKNMNSGMYYYTLEAGTTSITKRMTLLK